MYSFDILLLGLKNPSNTGQSRYANAMARLTGRSEDEFAAATPSFDAPIFSGLEQSTAQVVARALGEAGALIEVRRAHGVAHDSRDQVVATDTCPTCGFVQPAGGAECSKCGLIFAKFEREQVQQMQQDRGLEEALTTALKVREEWDQRASQYLETHPLQQGVVEPFSDSLVRGEIPFQGLNSDEGPILLTSRRMVARHKDETFSIPYELIEDVTFGGGLVTSKKKTRMLLAFHAPLPAGSGAAKSLSWQIDKESTFYKDVVMDWSFSRNFICGACGARDLDFRLDDDGVHSRCMHCATDHTVDLREALAIPAAVAE
jgi:hypothetical protein